VRQGRECRDRLPEQQVECRGAGGHRVLGRAGLPSARTTRTVAMARPAVCGNLCPPPTSFPVNRWCITQHDQEAGLLVRHEVSATTFAQIEEERERLMGRSELVPIYVLGFHEHGPAAHDMRLNLTVATGSFAKTDSRDRHNCLQRTRSTNARDRRRRRPTNPGVTSANALTSPRSVTGRGQR